MRFKQFKELRESKAECLEKFEKVLFGSFRKKRESDTQIESEFFQLISDFINLNDVDKKSGIFNELLDCKEYYRDILIPKVKVAYRGIVLDEKSWNKIKFHKKEGKYWIGSLMYKQKRPVESWTKSLSTAKKFSDIETDYFSGLILEHEIDDTYLFNAGFLNKIGKQVGLGFKENEIMKIGLNKKFKVQVYATDSKYKKMVNK